VEQFYTKQSLSLDLKLVNN